MRRLVRSLTVIAAIGCWGPMVEADRPEPDLDAGRTAYQQSCARCHGTTGRGDGVDAKRFYPRPRDLTTGTYKIRTTVSGTPPTDDDLFRAIAHGLPGTNMPDWGHLDEATRWHLVAYLKSLSDVFQSTPPEPVDLGDDPGAGHADLAKGRAVYEQLGCAACHGAHGRANGTSAAGLVDDWSLPIRPANLTQGWSFRGGSSARDILTRLLAGIDGSGMPAYTGAVSPEDAWQLAYYVASLQEPPHWHRTARAWRAAGPLPSTVADPQWEQVERTDVRLRNAVGPDGTWTAPPTATCVGVQVAWNDETIAWRLTWDDPTQEAATRPADALAVALRPADVAGDTVTLQAWPVAGSPSLDLCYWSAHDGRAREAVVGDAAALREGRASASALVSDAVYADGRWQLVLQRPLHPAQPPGAAVIDPERVAPPAVAFIVWDGGNAEAKAISSWLDVALHDE